MNITFLKLWHKRISMVISIPLLLIILTGIILQFRNVIPIIQPTTITAEPIAISSEILQVKEIEKISTRIDNSKIDQIIYRPSKNSYAVRFVSGREIQLHAQSGEILSNQMRYTGWLIELHQGSFAGKFSQYFIFPLTALGLLFLLISGVLLFFKLKRII
jgi:uncharacterized iron-regulated membrane protein